MRLKTTGVWSRSDRWRAASVCSTTERSPSPADWLKVRHVCPDGFLPPFVKRFDVVRKKRKEKPVAGQEILCSTLYIPPFFHVRSRLVCTSICTLPHKDITRYNPIEVHFLYSYIPGMQMVTTHCSMHTHTHCGLISAAGRTADSEHVCLQGPSLPWEGCISSASTTRQRRLS